MDANFTDASNCLKESNYYQFEGMIDLKSPKSDKGSLPTPIERTPVKFIFVQGDKSAFKLDTKNHIPDEIKRYYNAFFRARKEAFGNAEYYPEEPTQYDNAANSLFMIAIDGTSNQIIGGRRISIHEKGSEDKLETESCIIPLSMSHWHLKNQEGNLNHLKYADFGSFFVCEQARNTKLSEALYYMTYNLIKELHPDLNFIATELAATNFMRLQKNTEKNLPDAKFQPMRDMLLLPEDFEELQKEGKATLIAEDPLILNKDYLQTRKVTDELSNYLTPSNFPDINTAIRKPQIIGRKVVIDGQDFVLAAVLSQDKYGDFRSVVFIDDNLLPQPKESTEIDINNHDDIAKHIRRMAETRGLRVQAVASQRLGGKSKNLAQEGLEQERLAQEGLEQERLAQEGLEQECSKNLHPHGEEQAKSTAIH